MEKSKTSNRYSPEMRARAVRMVMEHQGSYETLATLETSFPPAARAAITEFHEHVLRESGA